MILLRSTSVLPPEVWHETRRTVRPLTCMVKPQQGAQHYRRCAVCAGDLTYHLTMRGTHPIWRCVACGHGWVDPVPDSQTLVRFYASREAECQYDYSERSIRKHAGRLFRWISQVKSAHGRLLDVGCGRGVHLEVAQALGWQCLGIDWSPIARQLCQARGLNVLDPAEVLDQPERYKAAFDVITAWEVIEHQPEPESFLRTLKRFLNSSGVLALSTPNFNSIRARADYSSWYELRPPMHLHYFTPESLKKLLERCGLFVLNQLTYGSWNGSVDRSVDRVAGLLPLSEATALLVKVACYKFAKVYFDRQLQSKLQGLGLLTMAGPSEIPIPRLRKYFYF